MATKRECGLRSFEKWEWLGNGWDLGSLENSKRFSVGMRQTRIALSEDCLSVFILFLFCLALSVVCLSAFGLLACCYGLLASVWFVALAWLAPRL